MKLVKESLSFERGQGPKASMGVGKIAQINGWLDKMGVKNYTINNDFTIDVDGNVILDHTNLAQFPEYIQFNNIKGSFTFSDNNLNSLKGAPKSVGVGFDCSNNRLTSLKGAPKSVGGGFECSRNHLTSLEGAPERIGGYFHCSKNQLTSLEGAPKMVGGYFQCSNNITEFTKKDVRKVCRVEMTIIV